LFHSLYENVSRKRLKMIQFPSSSQSPVLTNTTAPKLRKSHSLSSVSSNGSLQNDVLELSNSAIKSLEHTAYIDELSGDFPEAASKYTSLLKKQLGKHGENSIEAAGTRSSLIHALLKTGKQDEANYQIERLKHSLSQDVSPQTKKTIESMLVAMEKAKKQANQSWFNTLEQKLTAKREILNGLERKEQMLRDAELQALQTKEHELKLKARQTQKQQYIGLVDDLKALKIDEVDNLGFSNDIQIQNNTEYDDDDKEILLMFNHGKKISLSSLDDSVRVPFSANIEELLAKTPKKYDVTPASSGTPVKITEVGELLPSLPFRHLIASKALIQWKQADTPEDKIAWERQIKDWFNETPERLEKLYPSHKSLYDLFMDSEQNKGLDSLAGMQDLKNYFVTNVISPQFDSENTQGYRGIILYGEPGNGKTVLSTALARHTGFNFYHIRRGDLETTYKNGVAETIAKTLKHARDNKPSVVILEEVDSIAASRDNTQSSDGSDAKETTAIMNGIDQLIEDNPPVILMATTNYIDKLDKAFRREGRFHDEVEIHNPDQELREYLFKTYLKKFNNSEALAKKAATISDGLTTAAIRTICEYDIANDSKIQSRFRKVSSESTSKELEFDKLKECIERRKNKIV